MRLFVLGVNRHKSFLYGLVVIFVLSSIGNLEQVNVLDKSAGCKLSILTFVKKLKAFSHFLSILSGHDNSRFVN